MKPIPAKSTPLAKTRKLRVLVLDDEPERIEHFRQYLDDGHAVDITHAPTAKAAHYQLKSHDFDVVFLDHDLELSAVYWGMDDHGSGTDVVDWLTRIGPARWDLTLFVVHSLNRNKGREMAYTLKRYGFSATRRAYAWLDVRDLHSLARDWEWPKDLERWDVSWPMNRPVMAGADGDMP